MEMFTCSVDMSSSIKSAVAFLICAYTPVSLSVHEPVGYIFMPLGSILFEGVTLVVYLIFLAR